MKTKAFSLFLGPAVALMVSLKVCAQSFYVIPAEKGFESKIVDKIRSDAYKLTDSESAADYKIECIVTGAYRTAVLIKKKKDFYGYVRITDGKNGNEIARTEEVGKIPSIYNGYQAGPAIMSKIARKYLKKAMDKVVAD